MWYNNSDTKLNLLSPCNPDTASVSVQSTLHCSFLDIIYFYNDDEFACAANSSWCTSDGVPADG